MKLTRQQLAIVGQAPATMAVYAAPGSGKTTVLTQHVIRLLKDRVLAPNEIWAITFTRKAAHELKQRLLHADGIQRRTAEALHVSTFHARMFALLLANNPAIPRIMDARTQRKLLAMAAQGEGISPTTRNLQRLQQLAAFTAVTTYVRLPAMQRRIVERYEVYKGQSGVWDYEDILVSARAILNGSGAKGLIHSPVSYILVDEYQDTNAIQFDILERIIKDTGAKLFVVGDDDQAIYSFRGGTPRYLTDFAEMLPEAAQFELTVNFRTTERLLVPAWRLIACNRYRHEKTFVAAQAGGQRICIRFAASDHIEAENVIADVTNALRYDPGQSVAVLARTRRQLGFLKGHALHLRGVKITVSTFHEAKGREWDTVIIMGAIDDHPFLPVTDLVLFDRDPEEERRLFYVAMTRARKRLIIHVPLRIQGLRMTPSRFLFEAGLIRS